MSGTPFSNVNNIQASSVCLTLLPILSWAQTFSSSVSEKSTMVCGWSPSSLVRLRASSAVFSWHGKQILLLWNHSDSFVFVLILCFVQGLLHQFKIIWIRLYMFQLFHWDLKIHELLYHERHKIQCPMNKNDFTSTLHVCIVLYLYHLKQEGPEGPGTLTWD